MEKWRKGRVFIMCTRGRKSSEMLAGSCPIWLSHPTHHPPEKQKEATRHHCDNQRVTRGGRKLIHQRMMQGWVHWSSFLRVHAHMNTHIMLSYFIWVIKSNCLREEIWLNLVLSPLNNTVMYFPPNKVTVTPHRANVQNTKTSGGKH